ESARLFDCVQCVLREWIDRLGREANDGFPEKVTAFRPEMAVHGRYGKPCPVCGSPIQRIVYAENESNYCAVCQTGGKLLADRSIVLLTLWMLIGNAYAYAQPDLILHHGKIVTVDDRFSIRPAVAIRDGRILRVGTDREILAIRGPKTRVEDLRGRMVLPGL